MERRLGGRKIVRRGVPDSRKAEGLNVKSRGFTSGVAVEERGGGDGVNLSGCGIFDGRGGGDCE